MSQRQNMKGDSVNHLRQDLGLGSGIWDLGLDTGLNGSVTQETMRENYKLLLS